MNKEEMAGLLYETYCQAVGGKAFNGDSLPAWKEFSGDASKSKQANAWRIVAETTLAFSRGEL